MLIGFGFQDHVDLKLKEWPGLVICFVNISEWDFHCTTTTSSRHVDLMLGFYSSDGRAIRASALDSGAVNLGLIPSRVRPMTSKLVFTASLLNT